VQAWSKAWERSGRCQNFIRTLRLLRCRQRARPSYVATSVPKNNVFSVLENIFFNTLYLRLYDFMEFIKNQPWSGTANKSLHGSCRIVHCFPNEEALIESQRDAWPSGSAHDAFVMRNCRAHFMSCRSGHCSHVRLSTFPLFRRSHAVSAARASACAQGC
jgi:hypothetical protein